MTTFITQPIGFNWRRCVDYNEMAQLYEQVIPAVDLWNPTILTKHPDIVKGYVAYDAEERLIACAVIGMLHNSNCTYIDCFAISKEIRGKKLSYVAWETFIKFLKLDWPALNTNRLIIEVYLQNVEIWAKVMGISNLDIDNVVDKPKLVTDTIIMGKNMSCTKDSISTYAEWQQTEANW